MITNTEMTAKEKTPRSTNEDVATDSSIVTGDSDAFEDESEDSEESEESEESEDSDESEEEGETNTGKMFNLSKDYENCDFENNTYLASHTCNQFLLKKEILEKENVSDEANNNLYPTLNDPNFSLKIARKREFFDTQYDGQVHNVEEHAELLANASFEMSPHQLFVKNFLSSFTPYNSLLLFHGLGSGKTLSAIGICEEHRDYIKQQSNFNKILVVASPNVQENFKLQLFNESYLKNVNGIWTMDRGVGNKLLQEVNPTFTKNIEKSKIVSQVKRMINDAYDFMGYREFANYVEKKQNANVNPRTMSKEQQLVRMKRNLKMEFDDKLICIDEVHNIRSTEDNENKKVAAQILFLVKNTKNMRLLFLSGTPMFNSHKEIIWMVNLMNMNDGRGVIKMQDVFNPDGSFKETNDMGESGRELLKRKVTGYISYVRGENPYTFPFRVYPNVFAKENTYLSVPKPTTNFLGQPVAENSVNTVTESQVYLVKLGEYQKHIYEKMIQGISKTSLEGKDNADQSLPVKTSGGVDTKLSYTKLQDPIRCINMVFPIDITGMQTSTFDEVVSRGSINVKDMIGTSGLKNTMNYVDERSETLNKKGDFEYKSWVSKSEHSRFFGIDNIGKYSGKIKKIADSILSSEGVVLIYSQYIDGALIPMALTLEEMGITRLGSIEKSLFKEPPTKAVDFETFKPLERSGDKKSPAKYILITGDKRLSPNNLEEIVAATDAKNKDGEKVKVILVSMAGSEGVDLKFIRQVHVIEPWYNLSRIEQVIGRAVRNESHKILDFQKRNVQIFLYSSLLEDGEKEPVDLSIYRSAEYKAILIGKVTSLLKEVSVDCFLNLEQRNFDASILNQKVKQVLADGTVVDDYEVGDKQFTMMTDFMEDGQYKCANTQGIDQLDNSIIDDSTYDEKFIFLNTDKIIQKIKDLFKLNFFYLKDDLIAGVNYPKVYPVSQIYSALTILIENNNEYIQDMYGRDGKLVNIGDYYLFQPAELLNQKLSLFERSVPLTFKQEKLKLSLDLPSTTRTSMLDQVEAETETETGAETEAIDATEGPLIKMRTALEKSADQEDSNMKVSADSAAEEKSSLSADLSIEPVLRKLQSGFESAILVFENDISVKRGETDIYKYFGSAMKKLKRSGLIAGDADTKLKELLVAHLVDHLEMPDKVSLFLQLDKDSEMEKITQDHALVARMAYVYLKTKEAEYPHPAGGKMRYMVFFDASSKEKVKEFGDGKKKGKFVYYTKHEKDGEDSSAGSSGYMVAEPIDKRDIVKHISALRDSIAKDSSIGEIIGFIGNTKTVANIIFKIKDDTSNSRSKGKVCEQGNDSLKEIMLKRLIEMNVPSESERVIESLQEKKSTKKSNGPKSVFISKEVCVFYEFLTRYFNEVQDTVYFFDYEKQHILSDILNTE